jgi:hypothetical protein
MECDTPSAFVSSGKRYSVSFAYTPISVKTLEVQFEFTVLGHGMVIPIFVVGRILSNS